MISRMHAHNALRRFPAIGKMDVHRRAMDEETPFRRVLSNLLSPHALWGSLPQVFALPSRRGLSRDPSPK
jgi:hypothetical protein